MTAKVKTFSFLGINVLDVDVEVKISQGLPNITIVGLPDKAIGESRERVRHAISSLGVSWPQKRITVNMAPADLQKEGSHFDLAIAIGILIEMGIVEQSMVENFYLLGELTLDGSLNSVNGIISAAIGANERRSGLICPQINGSEASYAAEMPIIASENLLKLIGHLKGESLLPQTKANKIENIPSYPDLIDVKGQENAKRALEIAAAGGHNLLMIGPPGTGKSMLASRLNGILPPPSLEEILEINMIHSISGKITNGNLVISRPYRDPHHSCSMPAMVGGGTKAKPGEISLACNGVLFLDELPEFPRQVLDSLRQPLETGQVTISRANSHITYPANFQLIAAMNPCRCGFLGDSKRQCKKAPDCGIDYQNKISGPILDRIDMVIEVAQTDIFFENNKVTQNSESIRNNVFKARDIQYKRYHNQNIIQKNNSKISNSSIEKYIDLDDDCKNILKKSSEKLLFSMRAISRILRVARTIADLDQSENIKQVHLLEAISYRKKI